MKPNQPDRHNCGIVKHQPGQAMFARFVAATLIILGSLYYWSDPLLRYFMGAR